MWTNQQGSLWQGPALKVLLLEHKLKTALVYPVEMIFKARVPEKGPRFPEKSMHTQAATNENESSKESQKQKHGDGE